MIFTALVPMLAGILLGLFLFPIFASPFGPGLWILAPMFARIFHTVAQVIRKQGILVKRSMNNYEFGIYDSEKNAVYLDGDWREDLLDADQTRWALFGKRPLGVTWELGTDLHQKVRQDDPLDIDMGAVHRYLRGVNESDAITRTEEKAKAEHGGGSDGFSAVVMVVGIVLMIMLGVLTTFFMV